MTPKHILFCSSYFLMIWSVFILTISSLVFLFGFDLNLWIFPLGFIFSVLVLFFTNKNRFEILYSVLTAVVISLISYYFAVTNYDTSWDGQGYHQETVYLLKNGWNPIYEDSGAFRIWVNLYQKGNEIIQANIYLLTNKIEAGKLINLVFAYCAFSAVYTFLANLRIKRIYHLLLALVTVFNPVVFTQFFTYYIDGNWYLTLIIAIFSFLDFILTKKMTSLILFASASVIFCALKFSSVPVFVVFSVAALGYAFYRKKKEILYAYGIVAVLGVLCNIHPFITNLSQGNPLLYPFVGEKKIDIINQNIPKMMLNKNRAERLFISLFSKTDNNINAEFPQTLKIPFSANRDELFINYDTRLGGFGFLFSGVIVLSILLMLYLLISKKEKSQRLKFILILSVLLCSILINPASWWSRLSPQIWLFPVLVIVFGLMSQHRFSTRIAQVLLGIFLLNILLPGYISYRKLKDDQKIMKEFITSVGNKTIVLDLSSTFAFQQYFLKFKEKNIRYTIEKLQDKSRVAPFTPDVYYEIR